MTLACIFSHFILINYINSSRKGPKGGLEQNPLAIYKRIHYFLPKVESTWFIWCGSKYNVSQRALLILLLVVYCKSNLKM